MARDVILLHGLWMPGLVMSVLASRLAKRGYRMHVFGYASRAQPLAAHAGRLARYAREVSGGGPVHFRRGGRQFEHGSVGHEINVEHVLRNVRKSESRNVRKSECRNVKISRRFDFATFRLSDFPTLRLLDST